MKKVLFFLAATFTFSFSYAQYYVGPASISITGGGTFCINESTTITASVSTDHFCGNGGSTKIGYTIKIYSNTTNSTTGGTLVQTCTVSQGTGNSTCNYTAPNSTAGTLYYYAVVEWSANGCYSAGSIKTGTTTVVVQSTCVTCSQLLVYNDSDGDYHSHNSNGISTYSSKISFNGSSACSEGDEINFADKFCKDDYGYAQACDEFNNTTADVSSTSNPWYYFDFTPKSNTVEICGIELYIWAYGDGARKVQIGYSIGGGAWTKWSSSMVTDTDDCDQTDTPSRMKLSWTFGTTIKTASNIRVRIQPFDGISATDGTREVDLFQASILGIVPSLMSSLVFKAEGISEKESNTINWMFDNSNSPIEHFIVQKSQDGINFTDISVVWPKENATIYSFIDNSPFQTNYYKIISEDINGNVASSNTIILKQKKGDFLVNGIYPNPASDFISFEIDLNSRGEALAVKLINTLGQVLSENILSQSENITINTTNIEGGVYFLMFSTENEVQKHKIIIAK